MSETPERRKDDSLVHFTVKELLAQMFGKLERIEQKLEGKVDVSDLLVLEQELRRLEAQIMPPALRDRYLEDFRTLKTEHEAMRLTMATQQERRADRRWLFAAAIPGGLGGLAALVNLLVNHVGAAR